MDVIELRQQLDRINQLPPEVIIGALDSRKVVELSFHDQHRDRRSAEAKPQGLTSNANYKQQYGNKKYYAYTNTSQEYIERWIAENSSGKCFLDFACGNGGNAIRAARAGAKLAIGIDLSPISIKNAREDAKASGVSENTYFVQADAENTHLPSNSVDTVICCGVLHHLDLSYAFPELRRIMTPGAKLLALEALAYNPLIKLYRSLTPQMRTDWEKKHILSLSDLTFASRFFTVSEIKYWHLLSIFSPHLPALAGFFRAADSLLENIPYLQRLAWMFSFELIKPSNLT